MPIPDPVNKQLDQAVTYFSNSVRVPAALIAGQAGNMLYKLTEMPAAQGRAASEPMTEASSLRVAAYSFLWRAHLWLTGYSLCAQLTAVLLCSTAHAQILDISRDDLALEPTALDLINRHVQFEYVTVRIAFFSGLVAYLLAITMRASAALAVGPRGSTLTGRREKLLVATLATMLVSTLAWWGHLHNEEMANMPGMFHLTRRFVTLVFRRARTSPLAVVSVVAGLVSACLAVPALTGYQCGQCCSCPRPTCTLADGAVGAPAEFQEVDARESPVLVSPSGVVALSQAPSLDIEKRQ